MSLIQKFPKRSLLLAALLLGCMSSFSILSAQMNQGETVVDAALKNNPAMQPVKDVPGLPMVLLIGDSISIGYTLDVRKDLAGKANVHRIPTNGGNTAKGLQEIDQWLGDGKWDVIHFNFGIHDSKIITGTEPECPPAVYEKNLTAIVQRLQKTGAKLIWASTTPIPASLTAPAGPFTDVKTYNDIAARIMQANGIPIDDLYTLVLPQESEIQLPKNVHYNTEGWPILGKAVAASIEAQLPMPAPGK